MHPLTSLYGPQPPRLVIAPPSRQGGEGKVTFGDLGSLLAEAGLSWEAFVTEISQLDLAEAGDLLRYLNTVVFEGSPTPETLRFQLQFVKDVPPSDYARWEEIVRATLQDHPLSQDAISFLNDKGIDPLWRQMLLTVGQNEIETPERRSDPRLLVQSLFRFLELGSALVGADPNIAVVLDAVNNFGGLQQYYAKHDLPRTTVKKLLAAGYDSNYLAFSRQELLSRQAAKPPSAFSWMDDFETLITKIVGTDQTPPEIDLGVDQFKFWNELKDDRELMRTEHSQVAARRLAARLLPLLKARKAALTRHGLLVPAARLDEYIDIITRYEGLASNENSSRKWTDQRLVARRSSKQVPELFFDDTRLGSWLFKPEGIVHGEICRILLDPAVPLLEIWLEPYSEFMAAVPLYPGFNAERQRTILVETYHYDDRISDALGTLETMRFLLESILIDAQLAKAQKVAVFAAPWGRSAVFAEYVAGLAKQDKTIRYFESYDFEAVDPNSAALQNSLTGQFHYTEALGYNRPLKGTIDYGYNLVLAGTIEKLMSGGRGVFEIDVRAFLAKHQLLDKVPTKEEGVARERDTPLYQGAEARQEELTRREQHRREQAESALRAQFPDICVEMKPTFDNALRNEVLALHRVAFPEYAFIDERHYDLRMVQPDAELLVARSGGCMLGVALIFCTDALPESSLYIDEIAVKPDHQRKGIGTALLDLAVRIASIRGFRQIFLLTRLDPLESPLMRFYEQRHFRWVTQNPDIGRLLHRPLALFGPENRDEIELVIDGLRRRLSPAIPSLRIDVHDGLRPGLIDVIQSLETVFPEDIRYSREALKERLEFRDVCALMVWSGATPIAFLLSYQDPSLPPHLLFGDVLCVKPEWRLKQIGVGLVRAIMNIARLTGYTDILLYCRERTEKGQSLVNYYKHFGANVIDTNADKVRMMIPLRVNESGPRRAHNAPNQAPSNASSGRTAVERADWTAIYSAFSLHSVPIVICDRLKGRKLHGCGHSAKE
jgi:GNAT superfamily N-acetyltransferase